MCNLFEMLVNAENSVGWLLVTLSTVLNEVVYCRKVPMNIIKLSFVLPVFLSSVLWRFISGLAKRYPLVIQVVLKCSSNSVKIMCII